MPQTLRTGVTRDITRVAQSTMPRTPPHQMVMYPVQPSQSGWFEQARTPLVMVVLTPQCCSEIVVKENLAEGDIQRGQEMTVDKGEESKISVVSMMPKS